MAKRPRGSWKEKNARGVMGPSRPDPLDTGLILTPLTLDEMAESLSKMGVILTTAMSGAAKSMSELSDAMKRYSPPDIDTGSMADPWRYATVAWRSPVPVEPAKPLYGFSYIGDDSSDWKSALRDKLSPLWHKIIGIDGEMTGTQLKPEDKRALLERLAFGLGWQIQSDETINESGLSEVSSYGIHIRTGCIHPSANELTRCLGSGTSTIDEFFKLLVKFLDQSDSFYYQNEIELYSPWGTIKNTPKRTLKIGHHQAMWEVRIIEKEVIEPPSQVFYDKLLCALVSWVEVSNAFAASISGIPDWSIMIPFYARGGIQPDGHSLDHWMCPCGSGDSALKCTCDNRR